MSLSSNYLDAFLACAQLGHFTRASEKLGITQSALSQRVMNLEKDLGTSLFVRDRSSGIRLTPVGEEVLRYCLARESLEKELLENLQPETYGELSGYIRIGGFSSVMRSAVLPCLKDLLNKNPKLKIQILSREIDELPLMLKKGEIDFMISYRALEVQGVVVEDLGVEKNVLVEKKKYSGQDIYLDHDENDQVTASYLKKIRKKSKYQRSFLDDVYGLIDGVKMGLGRAVIPYHLIKGDKELKILKPKISLDIPVKLHYYEQAYYSHLHKAVLSELKSHFKKYLT